MTGAGSRFAVGILGQRNRYGRYARDKAQCVVIRRRNVLLGVGVRLDQEAVSVERASDRLGHRPRPARLDEGRSHGFHAAHDVVDR